MSRQPFEFYVDSYNMVSNSRQRAAYRFSKNGWHSLMKYRQYEIDDAVKAAIKAEFDKPKLEMLKEWRWKEVLCTPCSAPRIAGQAFRDYRCAICKQTHSYPNTAVPKICTPCAISKFVCQRCGESMDKELL